MRLPLPGTVELWVVRPADLRPQLGVLSGYLSEPELARASGYKLAVPREQFVLARGFLRKTLSTYLAMDPRSVELGTTANEKPNVVGDPVQFNVSHTSNVIALAIARDRPVGIDVEQIQPRSSLHTIVRQQFHPQEQVEFELTPESDRLGYFYRVWTCKEAYLKGLGAGFSIPLSSFAMRFRGDEYEPEPNLDNQPWRLRCWQTAEYALAVAAPGGWVCAFRSSLIEA